MNPISLMCTEDTINNSGYHTKDTYDFLKKYKYSSLADYVQTKRPEEKIVNKDMYMGYLPSPENIQTELQDWLEYEYEIPVYT